MNKSIGQLFLIGVAIATKLIWTIDYSELLSGVDGFLAYEMYLIMPTVTIIALLLTSVISLFHLSSKEPSNKFRDYLFIGLSISLIIPEIARLIVLFIE